APKWKEPLTSLRETLTTQKEKEEELLKTNRQVLYLIDIPATLGGKGLVIEVAYRQMLRNGQWGKIKSYPNSYFKVENIPDPDDQQIIALLIGSRYSNEYSYVYRYPAYYGGNPLGYLSPGPLQTYLMERICRTGRCFLRKANYEIHPIPLRWDEGEPWEFYLCVEKESSNNAYHLKGYLQRGEDRISLEKPLLLFKGGLIFFEDKVSRLLDNGIFGWISLLRNQRNLLIPLKEGDAFIQELMAMPLLPNLSLPEELQYEEIHLTPRPMLKVRAPERKTQWDSDRLNWDLWFDYEGHIIPDEEPARGILIEKPRRFIVRDFGFEKKAYERLKELGFRKIKSYGYRRRDVSPRNLPRAVRELLAEGWHVEAEGKVYRRPGVFKLSVSTGIDWFELHGEVQFEDRVVKLPELLKTLKRGEHLIPLDDGTFGIVPEEWLKKYGAIASLGTAHDDHLRFSRFQAGLLDALLSSLPESTCDELFQRIREKLRSFEGVSPCDPPKGFMGQLRDYQKDGLGWIHFLEKFGFGGCLADDMGLGKTIQVLAMLEERRQKRSSLISEDQGREHSDQRDEYLGPSLVVAPKSLVFNWIQEAKRFTPQLKILDHTGSGRLKPDKHFENYDLILTTYGTLRRDAIEFKNVHFDYCILDEGQMIKNANTQSAKATRLINAKHRLVLSGTPIENHLGELWSLFEFLNPGMLGSASVFKLTGPGSRNPDPQTRELLGKALRPFILRRTKGQVASELPEKFEQTIYCELESKQRKLYDELRDHYRQTLLHQVEERGMNKSKIQILEALLRLRQAACHPGLIDKSKRSYPSTKLEILLLQLEQVMEDHKALVFSQFTSFLAILREELEKQKTPYAYLDGQTRNRKEVVERFQKDSDCRLFLISLKAGGLGLNLTEAEYVYLLDPWWNPAVEMQAIDRTHRIGQTKKVFAYRIIAKDTVEEKVLELQQTKRDLAEAIINVDNSLIRNLSKEDLELLLS
ncbi:MAG: DEAD/DEAH box helicase, partial [Thermodesulfobacteriota bacterium]